MSWGENSICLIQSKVILMKNPTRSLLPQSIMDGIFNELCMANSLTPLPSINTVPQHFAGNKNASTRSVWKSQTQLSNLQQTLCVCPTAKQEVIVRWCSTCVTMQRCSPVNYLSESRPHWIPMVYYWKVSIQMISCFEMFYSGSSIIVLLWWHQCSDGIGEDVKSGCITKEVGSRCSPDVRRDI
jgi:hypothetical protein